MKKSEPSHSVGGMENGINTVENSLAVPQTVKHKIITWPSNSILRYMTKQN